MFDSTDRGQVTLRETMDTQVEEAGDVVVFGSGSAGVTAAISAARHGARTTLVDQAGFVGGNLVSSLPIITAASDRALVQGNLSPEDKAPAGVYYDVILFTEQYDCPWDFSQEDS